MKNTIFVMMLAALALVATAAFAGTAAGPGPGYKLIYEPPPPPGDGLPNLLGYDDDGDGIPNGQDPDYVPPADGTGRKFGTASARSEGPQAWVRNWFRFSFRHMAALFLAPSGYGPGNGDGYGGIGPKDGTGYGPGPYGDGVCDDDCPMLRKQRPR